MTALDNLQQFLDGVEPFVDSVLRDVSSHGAPRQSDASRLSPSDEVRNRASTRGWDFEFAQCVRMSFGSGRVADMVKRNDAARLYEDMHRRSVAVIYDGKALRKDLSEATIAR